MDQILLDVEQLISPKIVYSVLEDEIRKQFTQYCISNESITQLKSLPGQEIKEFVYCTIQIIDVLEQDVFVGAVKKADSTTIYPLGCEEKIEGSVMYFDKQSYTGLVLEENFIYKPTQQIVTLSSCLSDTIKPLIYNVFRVLAIKYTNEDQVTLNVIKFIETQSNPPNALPQIYQQLINTLNCQIRDLFASEQVALHLLCASKYETYFEGGRQILNLFNISSEQANAISKLIKQIYSPSTYIPLEQQYLSTVETLSSKNYDTNQIEQGIFMLPSNLISEIIVDETQLKEGQITGKVLQNLSNIQKFIQYSKIGIDFQYSVVEVPVQTNVLVLSNGKTFIETDNNIKVIQGAETPAAMEQNFDNFINYVHKEQCNQFLGDQLKKQINQRFTELRQQKLAIEITNLNRWILQMKILSVIHQEEPNYERFEQAVQFDLQRMQRF